MLEMLWKALREVLMYSQVNMSYFRNLLIIICKRFTIQNVTRENLDYVGNLGITKASFGSLK